MPPAGSDERIGFRPLVEDDLRLVHEWLHREHVRRWWGDPGSYPDVVDEYLPAIEGRDPTDLYAITVADTPIGLIQTYLVSDYPGHATVVDAGEEAAGLDLFIGDPSLVGRGLGSEVIRAFVDDVVFVRAATRSCVADPDVRNGASIRSFEKAGFGRVRDYHDPSDGQMHALLRIER